MVKKNNIKVIILAGGQGERFWPWSRFNYPKQFVKLPLTNSNTSKSLFQSSCERGRAITSPDNVVVVATANYARLIKQQIPWLKPANIILEPFGKNTAIAIATACAKRVISEETVFVMPADHYIPDTGRFLGVAKQSIHVAQTHNVLVTIGITPNRPEPGFGYLKTGARLDTGKGPDVWHVAKFVEKPGAVRAKKMLREKKWRWNSGMFAWKREAFIDGLRSYMPEHYKALTALSKDNLRQVYNKAPDISVDYGLMERADNVVMVDGNFKWYDLGTWDVIYEVGKKDSKGNVLLGDKSRVCLKDTSNTLVATKDRTPLVACTGIKDSLIIATPDVLLVLPRGKGQKVRDIYRVVSEKNAKLK